MKIQKGLVKYKERSDIICTYGITDDGRQYYFLNDTKLANNNVIVSNTLVEAVDPNVVKANVGVVDEKGDIVIDCVNRSIRLVTNNILLVERANPTSPSVVDALKTRKDPLAATKLVSTPSVIKDKMFALMGDTGKFIFNDQFSEASLFNIDGVNLIKDKYYSFIAINKKEDTIYLCSNTKESNVDVYTIATGELVENNAVEENAVNVPTDVPVPEAAPEQAEAPVETPAEVPAEAPVEAPQEASVETPAELPTDVPAEVPTEGVADPNQTPVVPEQQPEANAAQEQAVPAEAPQEEVQSELQSLGTDVEGVPETTKEAVPESMVLPTAEEMAAVQGTQPVDENKYVATPQEALPEVPDGVAVPEVPLTDINPVQPEDANVPMDVTAGLDNNMPVENNFDVVPEDNSALVNNEPISPVQDNGLVSPEEVAQSVEAETPQEEQVNIPEATEEVQEEVEIPTTPPVVEENDEEVESETTPEVPEEEEVQEETSSYDDVQKIDDEDEEVEEDDIDKFLNSVEEDYEEEEEEDMSVDTDYYDRGEKRNNNSNIMDDAATTISKLIETNKNQKDELDDYRNQVRELNNLNKKVVDKAKRDKEKTRTSIQNYEMEIERLKSQMDDLENSVREKESKLSSQQKELSDLRDKLQGSQNLEKVLKDAASLLDN